MLGDRGVVHRGPSFNSKQCPVAGLMDCSTDAALVRLVLVLNDGCETGADRGRHVLDAEGWLAQLVDDLFGGVRHVHETARFSGNSWSIM